MRSFHFPPHAPSRKLSLCPTFSFRKPICIRYVDQLPNNNIDCKLRPSIAIAERIFFADGLVIQNRISEYRFRHIETVAFCNSYIAIGNQVALFDLSADSK